MKFSTQIRWLVLAIMGLALVATLTGLLDQTDGQPFDFVSARGEEVRINNRGLYVYDTVSMAAQQQGNDFVALFVGIPLLALALPKAAKGSLRARFVLTGTVGFFLYTYMSVSVLAAFNALFPLYVILFGTSLYAFILLMLSFDLDKLKQSIGEGFPRRSIAVFLFVLGAFLLVAWAGRILPPLLSTDVPLLENTPTMVIQAMDLALIVPLAVIAGLFLLRRGALGYLLSAVVLMKAVTLGLAVSAMAVNMMRQGVAESLAITIPFMTITLLAIWLAIAFLRNVREAD